MRVNIQKLDFVLVGAPNSFIMNLLIHADAQTRIFICQVFSDKKILSLLFDHMSQIFDVLYQARVIGREKLGIQLRSKPPQYCGIKFRYIIQLQSNKITISIITHSPPQRNLVPYHIQDLINTSGNWADRENIKGLRMKSNYHHSILTNIKKRSNSGGREQGESGILV